MTGAAKATVTATKKTAVLSAKMLLAQSQFGNTTTVRQPVSDVLSILNSQAIVSFILFYHILSSSPRLLLARVL
jgi:hypothetical protein